MRERNMKGDKTRVPDQFPCSHFGSVIAAVINERTVDEFA